MKHIAIVIPHGHFSVVNVEGTHQLFTWVNGYLQSVGREPFCRVELVGLSRNVTLSTGLFTVNPERTLDEVGRTDLIVLPAIHGDLARNLEANAALVPWIQRQYAAGAEVMSLCVGSFFLAATGLLDGKPCSTHWSAAAEFRARFPKALLMDDRILTEADGIYTSGGAYSFTNLLVYLVEKYAGRDVAVATAKAFMIDIDRHSQSPFIVFSGQKTHGDPEVLAAQEFIERNFDDKISVDTLCCKLAIGRRTFERRFKRATANTVVEYIQRVKIEAAKKQLEQGRKTVNEVMFDVGYSDIKAFREAFRRMTGMSPVDYRNKYGRRVFGWN